MVPFFNSFPVICICPEVANLDMIIQLRPAEARLERRCSGLTLAGCQVPTKAALSLPLHNWTGGENIKQKARGSR